MKTEQCIYPGMQREARRNQEVNRIRNVRHQRTPRQRLRLRYHGALQGSASLAFCRDMTILSIGQHLWKKVVVGFVQLVIPASNALNAMSIYV